MCGVVCEGGGERWLQRRGACAPVTHTDHARHQRAIHNVEVDGHCRHEQAKCCKQVVDEGHEDGHQHAQLYEPARSCKACQEKGNDGNGKAHQGGHIALHLVCGQGNVGLERGIDGRIEPRGH